MMRSRRVKTAQSVRIENGVQQGKYAQIKRQNRYVDSGGWVRIRQENGTFRYEWNAKVSDQESTNQAYKGQDATYMGASGSASETGGKIYWLMKGGKARELTKKGSPGDFVDPLKITGESNLPIFSGGTFDGPTDVNTDPEKIELENINVKARFDVNNLTLQERKDLKIVQFVYSDNEPHSDDLGKIKGKLAFVDGGKNSAKNRAEPWYGYQESYEDYNYDKETTKGGLNFKLSDQPGAITQIEKWMIINAGDRREIQEIDSPHYDVLNFESYVVIPNYNGSGKFLIISVVYWGFKNENWEITKTIESPKMVGASQFSAKAQEIWDNDYGDSTYKIY